MNIVSAVIIVSLAVVGLVAVFREISLQLFTSRDECTVMYITRISANDDNIEFVLRSALAKRRWSADKNSVSAVCLNCELNDKNRKICERICREYGFARIMTKDEFLKSLD